MEIFLAAAAVAALVFAGEVIWRTKRYRTEVTRKLIHMSVGVFMASWPFWMDTPQIRILCLIFALASAVSLKFGILNSIHKVNRKSIGEVLFPLSILLVTFLTQSAHVYAVAVLHLSLADGLAGLLGSANFSTKRYKTLGRQNSVLGTLVFIAVSFAILGWFFFCSAAGGDYFAWPLLPLLPFAAALIENILPYGFDDVAVPLIIVLALNAAAIY